VSGRDVIDELIRKQVRDVASFAWVCQLRLWWQQELVEVHMVYTSLLYGYEYLGNTSRLVVTPLTDRCFRSDSICYKFQPSVLDGNEYFI
jgi:dynein heavy chain